MGPITVDGAEITTVVKTVVYKTHCTYLEFCITRCSREYITIDCGVCHKPPGEIDQGN